MKNAYIITLILLITFLFIGCVSEPKITYSDITGKVIGLEYSKLNDNTRVNLNTGYVTLYGKHELILGETYKFVYKNYDYKGGIFDNSDRTEFAHYELVKGE